MSSLQMTSEPYVRYQIGSMVARRPRKPRLPLIKGFHATIDAQGYPLRLVEAVEHGLLGEALKDAVMGDAPLPHGLPFRRVVRPSGRTVLSNGYIDVPLVPPRNGHIEVHPFGRIHSSRWSTFVRLIEGWAVEEFLEKAVRSTPPGAPRQRLFIADRHLKAVARTSSYCPDHVRVLRFAANGRFMFRLGEGHNTLWLVDSIGVGALYIFLSLTDAFRWLTGRSRMHEARHNGHCFIHAGDWERRAKATIASYLGHS